MTEETSTSFNDRIHILEKRESEREKSRGRRSLSFLVISVSLYVCHSRSFFPTDWIKYLTLILNYRRLFIFLAFFILRRTWFQLLFMGCTSSKHELTPEDLQFLKSHTTYSEKKIKSWYKGFMVWILFFLWKFSIRWFFLERLPERGINTGFIYPNL